MTGFARQSYTTDRSRAINSVAIASRSFAVKLPTVALLSLAWMCLTLATAASGDLEFPTHPPLVLPC